MSPKFNKYISCTTVIIFLFCGISRGGTASKSIVASRITDPPTIDGFLTDECWKLAVPVTGFKQYDPDEGAIATEGTSVLILYDDDALYIGAHCYDREPFAIVRQMTRRDRTVQADRFSIMIDSYHDHSTAFLFSGAVSGVQSDGLLSQDGLVYDVQWDAVWDFNAKMVPTGWSAEFKIPYSALRFSEKEGEYVWGINFRRYIARKQETDEWVLITRGEVQPGTISSVSKMGNLSGIVNIDPPLHIEMLPYHVSRLNYFSQPVPFPITEEYKPNIGIDFKYGVANNFMVDLAVNPDFGQVEVDKANLNLTVFETYYPEKRPFFMENSQIFTFGNSFDNKPLQLFYSRRIGRRPTGYNYDTLFTGKDTLILNKNATYSKKPEVTTILAAGKFSGRTDNGLEIGILTAVGDREEAVMKNINGVYSSKLNVEPRASYNIVRLQQSIRENSTVGLLITSSFKEQNSPAYNGGLDWKVRSGKGAYGCDGYIAGSAVKGPGNRLTGTAGRLSFGKLGGEHWLVFSAYDFSSRKFIIDDLGFYSQSREHGGYIELAYKEDRAGEPFRRYAIATQTERRWNWDNVHTVSRFEFEPSFEFRNFWQLNFDYRHEFPAYDDENKLSHNNIVPEINLYRRPSGDIISAKLRTDTRRSVEASLYSELSFYSKGAKSFLANLQVSIRPTCWMEFTPAVTLMNTENEEAWLVGYYVNGLARFGDRDVNYYDLSLRSTATFTPNLSIQFFGQILLAKWRYRNFRDLTGSTEFIYPDDNDETIDSYWKVFNANIVFRWEYLPGSTFYLVWTQGREGYAGRYDQNLLNDINDVFGIPMDNVILAKVTYWWSL